MRAEEKWVRAKAGCRPRSRSCRKRAGSRRRSLRMRRSGNSGACSQRATVSAPRSTFFRNLELGVNLLAQFDDRHVAFIARLVAALIPGFDESQSLRGLR